MNLIGLPYRHNDFVGEVIEFKTKGSFSNCYEVKVVNEKTNETCHWWFKKDVMEAKYSEGEQK